MKAKEKILITGGSGFIGTNLIDCLKDKYCILNLDISDPRSASQKIFHRRINILEYEIFLKELTNFEPSFVIHLAARTDLSGKSIDEYKTNTTGTLNLLNALKQCKSIKKVIFCSSKFVTPNGYEIRDEFDTCPHTCYGHSKQVMEDIIRNHPPNCEWLIVRPTSIWGPYFSEPYKQFFEFIMKGFYFHIGRNKCYKTYGYVGNAVYQIHQLLINDLEQINTKVFYLGDYTPYEVSEWADEIAKEAHAKIYRVPRVIVRLVAFFGDFLKALNVSFPMTSFRYFNMVLDGTNNLDSTKCIVKSLPFTRKQGIRKTILWLRQL